MPSTCVSVSQCLQRGTKRSVAAGGWDVCIGGEEYGCSLFMFGRCGCLQAALNHAKPAASRRPAKPAPATSALFPWGCFAGTLLRNAMAGAPSFLVDLTSALAAHTFPQLFRLTLLLFLFIHTTLRLSPILPPGGRRNDQKKISKVSTYRQSLTGDFTDGS